MHNWPKPRSDAGSFPREMDDLPGELGFRHSVPSPNLASDFTLRSSVVGKNSSSIVIFRQIEETKADSSQHYESQGVVWGFSPNRKSIDFLSIGLSNSASLPPPKSSREFLLDLQNA